MNKHSMLSLYDYLGKAAGKELGAECEKFHRYLNLPSSSKEIQNSIYKGRVKTYERGNLDKFFQIREIFSKKEVNKSTIHKKQQING